MLRLRFCLFAVLLVSAASRSQQRDTASIPRSEFSLYAGYSLLAPNIFKGADGAFGPESGWNAGVDVGITKDIAAAIDFSQYFANYGLGANSTPFVFMVGPRVHAPMGTGSKLRPFADFLVGGGLIQTNRAGGAAMFKSATTLAWNAGGGIDVRARKNLWFRGQAGYLHTSFTTWDTEIQQYTPNGHARIILGLLYRR